MATTGEVIWASLIKSSKDLSTPFVDSRRTWYLTFSFGRFIRYYSREVDISQSLLGKYEWVVPSRLKARVYLTLVLRRRGGFRPERVSVRLVWPYIVKSISGSHSGSGPFRYTFPFRSYLQIWKLSAPDGKYAKVKTFFIGMPYSNSYLLSGNSYSSPQKFVNLLFTSSVFPSLYKVKGTVRWTPSQPYRIKRTPRASPETRSTKYTIASHVYPGPYTSSEGTYEIYRRTWTGTVTPGFATKKRRQLPVNPHTVTIVKTDYTHGYDLRERYSAPTTTYNNGWRVDAVSFIRGPVVNTDPVFTIVANKALKNLNNNANTGVQANIAQNIGEFKQFSNMVAKTAARLTGAILSVKKGNFSQASEFLFSGQKRRPQMAAGNPSRTKSLASNWLEFQYGWKPLLNDVDESMRLLSNYMIGSTGSQWVTGSSNQVRSEVIPLFDVPGGKKIGHEFCSTFYSSRYGIEFKIDNSTTSFLSQLGFTSPVNLVWELLPYSFVVDWFLPVGEFLNSFSAGEGLLFVKGYQTNFGRRHSQIYCYYDGPMAISPVTHRRFYANTSRESVALNRTKLTSWPVQSFPQFKNPFSTTHVANALALMRTAFRR